MATVNLSNIVRGYSNLAKKKVGVLHEKYKLEGDKKLAVCKKCDSFSLKAFCKECNCYMPAKVLSNKAKCKLKKW